MDTREQIKEINKNISDALDFWQGILLSFDADEFSYYLDYTEEDLLNALYIFNHVAQNIGIKNGFFNMGNALPKMNKFREAMKECFGFDSIALTDRVLGKRKKKNNSSL